MFLFRHEMSVKDIRQKSADILFFNCLHYLTCARYSYGLLYIYIFNIVFVMNIMPIKLEQRSILISI
jgi:hypothetical protein